MEEKYIASIDLGSSKFGICVARVNGNDKYTGQHSFGAMEYEYSIMPHSGDWFDAGVLQEAYANKVTIKAVQGVYNDDGVLSAEDSFFTFDAPEKSVMISALKKAENGEGIVLRIWNTTGNDEEVKISTILPITSVTRARLDEQEIEKVELADKSFTIKLGAHKIETLILK